MRPVPAFYSDPEKQTGWHERRGAFGSARAELRHEKPLTTSGMMILVHGTAVAVSVANAWHGVLLRGPSGAGKSDLALRLIEGGARLVADDQVALEAEAGRVVARAPVTLAGQMEVRGLGIIEMSPIADAPLCLVCDLCAPEGIPRMPEPLFANMLDMEIALLQIAPFEASAPVKVRLGVAAALRGIVR